MNRVTCQASADVHTGAARVPAVVIAAGLCRPDRRVHQTASAASGSTIIVASAPSQPSPKRVASGVIVAEARAAATPIVNA